MLSDLWPYALLTVLLVAVWAFGTRPAGFPDVGRRTSLAPAGDAARVRRTTDAAGARCRAEPGPQQAARELDLRRLLAVADRDETDASFLGRTAFFALARVHRGARHRPRSRRWRPRRLSGVGAARRARRRAAALRRAAPRGSPAAGGRRSSARGHDDVGRDHDRRSRAAGRGLRRASSPAAPPPPTCATLVHDGWRRLIPGTQRSTVDLYRRIGEEFGIEQFTLVADALTTTNVGIAERDTYTRAAHAVYQQRLADARVRAARARILVTLPVAGMLIPLLSPARGADLPEHHDRPGGWLTRGATLHSSYSASSLSGWRSWWSAGWPDPRASLDRLTGTRVDAATESALVDATVLARGGPSSPDAGRTSTCTAWSRAARAVDRSPSPHRRGVARRRPGPPGRVPRVLRQPRPPRTRLTNLSTEAGGSRSSRYCAMSSRPAASRGLSRAWPVLVRGRRCSWSPSVAGRDSSPRRAARPRSIAGGATACRQRGARVPAMP